MTRPASVADIQVALHLEPYEGRSAESVKEDVDYLVGRYGAHPALQRSTPQFRLQQGIARHPETPVQPEPRPGGRSADRPPIRARHRDGETVPCWPRLVSQLALAPRPCSLPQDHTTPSKALPAEPPTESI